MKKILMILVALTFAVGARAEKFMTYGLEAGMNFNSLSFSRDMFNSSNRMGFFVGPKVKFKVPLLGFGADVAALYSLNTCRGLDMESGNPNTKSLSYLEIPINARYDFKISAVGLYLATGPQYNVCMSTNESMNAVGLSKTSTWSWNFGAGVELFNHLQVGINYTMPISNGGTWYNIPDLDVKSKTVKIRLGYYF